MSLKTVRYLLPAVEIDMDGFPVKQAMPTHNVQQLDPFLLLHHARAKYSQHRPARTQGVGPHPHRGFSPVTFVIEGEVHHRDSRGNSQVAKAGEVQWMHAGAGIIHSERPSENLISKKGRQEIVQIWINSPAARKMQQPLYSYLPEPEMPVIVSDDKKVHSKLIAGEYQGLKSKIPTQSDLLVFWGRAGGGGYEIYHVPEGFNSMLYLIRGKVRLTDFGVVEAENLVIFGNDGDDIELICQSDAQFLILCGAPIGEEVTRFGPYVMNTQTEILKAMRDYQIGKMGILIEED